MAGPARGSSAALVFFGDVAEAGGVVVSHADPLVAVAVSAVVRVTAVRRLWYCCGVSGWGGGRGGETRLGGSGCAVVLQMLELTAAVVLNIVLVRDGRLERSIGHTAALFVGGELVVSF